MKEVCILYFFDFSIGTQAVSVASEKPGIFADIGQTTESTFVIKVILSILAGLLLLNAFLYIKLAQLETVAHSPLLFSSQPITFSK